MLLREVENDRENEVGWVCPNCKVGVAPNVTSCPKCNISIDTASRNSLHNSGKQILID